MKKILLSLLSLVANCAADVLENEEISISGFLNLEKLDQVRSVRRREIKVIELNNGSISKEDVKILLTFNNIRKLVIGNPPEGCVISHDDFLELLKLPQLTSLSLCLKGLNHHHLTSLSKLEKLDFLSLSKHYAENFSLKNDKLNILEKLTVLNELELWNFSVDEKSLDYISNSNVRNLVIASSDLTEKSLGKFGKSKSLETVSLISPHLEKVTIKAFSTHAEAAKE